MPICPVCGNPTKLMPVQVMSGQGFMMTVEPEPLYQVSYKGFKEYVSPRCSDCYDKMMERREAKAKKT